MQLKQQTFIRQAHLYTYRITSSLLANFWNYHPYLFCCMFCKSLSDMCSGKKFLRLRKQQMRGHTHTRNKNVKMQNLQQYATMKSECKPKCFSNAPDFILIYILLNFFIFYNGN